MKTVTIVLDGTEYTVEELRSRNNAEWRAELEKHFSEIANAIEELGVGGEVEVNDFDAIAGLVRSFSGKLLGSVGIVHEMVKSYLPPNLHSTLDDAYDSEIIEAFIAILGLAYPFGSAVGKLVQLWETIGSTPRQT